MRDLFDMGERMQLPIILCGQVARQIVDNPDFNYDINVDKIEWIMGKRNLTPPIVSLFKTWNFKENDKGYEYTFEHVPVQIHVLQRRYSFLERPDMRFYKVDEFSVPNPFESYWKMRHMIK